MNRLIRSPWYHGNWSYSYIIIGNMQDAYHSVKRWKSNCDMPLKAFDAPRTTLAIMRSMAAQRGTRHGTRMHALR